jgi:predicted permease
MNQETLTGMILVRRGTWSLGAAQCALAAGLYLVATILPSILTWATTRFLHPKERGVLAGMSLGSSMDLFALPVVCLCMGGEALQVACLCSMVNVLVTEGLAPLYFSTAGPAFPKDFKHTDGGLYNGEWKGALKDGFGVYTYPSGAKYEGEWLDGTKEGRGVYTFAKGGIYEGEWRSGKMEGIGVRTYSSGKVSSGLWKDGKLIKAFDESQCALVVANASEAALVARRVFVGRIEMDAILRSVASQPAVWACVCGIGLMLTGTHLTPGLDYITVQLSKAHAPLALAALGLLFDTQEIEKRQVCLL